MPNTYRGTQDSDATQKPNETKIFEAFFLPRGFPLLLNRGIVLRRLRKQHRINATGSRLECPMQRLRTSVASPNIKRKALNSWAAVQDTYLSTKVLYFFRIYLFNFFGDSFVCLIQMIYN